MDKLKQKLKRRRREQRQKAERAEAEKLAAEFNEHYRGEGLKHSFKPKQIMKAYKQVEKETTCQAIVAATIATLWAMHKLHGYGSVRLFRLASEITVRVGWVGRGERSITQMREELKEDAQLDYMQYWRECDMSRDMPPAEYQRRSAVMRTVPYVLAMHLHAVYYTLFDHSITRSSVRMKRITQSIAETVIYAVCNDKLEDYRKALEQHGFHIDMNGRYGGKGVEDDEYNRYMRRIEA